VRNSERIVGCIKGGDGTTVLAAHKQYGKSSGAGLGHSGLGAELVTVYLVGMQAGLRLAFRPARGISRNLLVERFGVAGASSHGWKRDNNG
jgi:hypothetical protein